MSASIFQRCCGERQWRAMASESALRRPWGWPVRCFGPPRRECGQQCGGVQGRASRPHWRWWEAALALLMPPALLSVRLTGRLRRMFGLMGAEAGFLGLASTSAESALRRCVDLGARRVHRSSLSAVPRSAGSASARRRRQDRSAIRWHRGGRHRCPGNRAVGARDIGASYRGRARGVASWRRWFGATVKATMRQPPPRSPIRSGSSRRR